MLHMRYTVTWPILVTNSPLDPILRISPSRLLAINKWMYEETGQIATLPFRYQNRKA